MRNQALIITTIVCACSGVACSSVATTDDDALRPDVNAVGASHAGNAASAPTPTADQTAAGAAGALGAAGSSAAMMTAAMTPPAAPSAMNAPAASPEPTPAPSSTPLPAAWQPLLEGEWELAAGTEGYRCVRLTVQEDLYIKEFQPIAPKGTHHTLLSINPTPMGPDGISDCTAADNGHTTLLGSGVGENYSAGELPEGVAYKVAKGSQLNLNLHLFNTEEGTLKGLSGTNVRTTTADKVSQFAEVMLAGPVQLAIAPGRETTKGRCTLMTDTTVFAVAPHMHQLGVHLKATAHRGAGDPVVLYDAEYDFEEQRQYPAPGGPLALTAGDTVEVECTYQNDSERTVQFGESSLDEMCFIGLYRFPLADDGLICFR